MIITLLTYNIERGFHSSDHRLEQHRLDAAKNIVNKVNPDLFAIIEACYAAPNKQQIAMDYRTIFNFPYEHIGSYPQFGPRKGDEGANCLLSKLPLSAQTIQLNYKSAIRSSIPISHQVLTLDVVHPSYSATDQEKIETLTPLLNSKTNPYLVTGDFNTVHPNDTQNWDTIRTELQSFNKDKVEWIIQNWQNPKLIPWLEQQNLRDSLPKENRQSTVPTFYTYNKHCKGVRMDFTFVSSNIKIIDSYILKNSDTEIASDHYPLITIFEV